MNSITPTIVELDGGDERDPELSITAGNRIEGTIYWESIDKDIQRKWYLNSSNTINSNLKPGKYNIYAEIRDKKKQKKYYSGTVDVSFKKQYRFSF